MIYIANKKRKLESIKAEFPNADILDITSNFALHSGQILSPFYPHRNIPIPFTDGITAYCVEAVWQGLKVFEHYGVDFKTFKNDKALLKKSLSSGTQEFCLMLYDGH